MMVFLCTNVVFAERVDMLKAGAKADGKKLNTLLINKTIDRLSSNGLVNSTPLFYFGQLNLLSYKFNIYNFLTLNYCLLYYLVLTFIMYLYFYGYIY